MNLLPTTMTFNLWIYIPVSHHSFFVNYSKLLYQGQYLQFFTNRYTLFWTLIAKLTQINNTRLSKSQAHKMLNKMESCWRSTWSLPNHSPKARICGLGIKHIGVSRRQPSTSTLSCNQKSTTICKHMSS